MSRIPAPQVPLMMAALLVAGIDVGSVAAAESSGLIGIQYGSGDFNRAQRMLKLDSLDQRWGKRDAFGVEWSGRWRGSLVGPITGQVSLTLETDQTASLDIDGKHVLDTRRGLRSASLTMVKGKKYPIILNFIKAGRGYDCRLRLQWTWSGSPSAPISGAGLAHTAETVADAKKLFTRRQDSNDDDKNEREQPVQSVRRYRGTGEGVEFHKRAGEMDITVDGKLFATYVWSDPKTTRPYFKQVHAAGGDVQITRHHPPRSGDLGDHETYHPGMWWGFGDVGGNDYWRMKARIIGGAFIQQPDGGKDRGSFAVRNRMLTNKGDATFCYQVCRYSILKRPAGILVISECTLTRDEGDFWLGDQEEMGMAVRVATPLAVQAGKGGVIRDSQGRTQLKPIRTNQSDWCNYSGPIAGKHGGILMMNDPRNFRKPWWHAVDTGLLIANPLGESELNGRGKKRQNVLVKKGQPFRLRYGILIHLHDKKNQFDAAQEYKQFVELLPSIGTPPTAKPRADLPTVPKGFKVSIFAQEPNLYKPTAVCFDAKGRLMVGQGPQYPRHEKDSPTDSVVVLTDSDQDGVADEFKTFATGFNSVQGLAWKGNDLYVANAPELTVVRDLDGDDEADEYVVVYTDLGNREHALHGLNWGPDGMLYMSKGNSKGHNQPEKYGYVAPKPFRELWDVVHPPGAPDLYPPKKYTKQNYKKTYHHWDDDWGREGGVLRCDPMGANLEIVSRGMRNPWDIAMDDGFNWLGTDNDQDQGDRIIMPFYGAHFGWGHAYSSHWTGKRHLPTAPISGPLFPGSGAGIIFYAHQHFPSNYQRVFFINDWMQGTFVYRPAWDGALMQPQGGRWERFAMRGGGMLYRPTDLEFGPDGSIYICGWGSDYHYKRGGPGSWMFRVNSADRPAATRSEWFGKKRDQPYSKWSIEQLVEDLGSETVPVWRVNAQDELVRRGVQARDALIKAIQSRSLSQGQETWALWALGRIAGNDAEIDTFFQRIAGATDPSGVQRKTPLNQRIQAIRILAFRIRRQTGRADERLTSLPLADPEPRVRFEAVQALRQARQKHMLPQLIDRLPQEDDRIVFYAAWQALRAIADVSARKKLLNDQRPRVRLAALLSLQERHEISLEDVLKIAETDADSAIQSWAMTWAMNPRPPRKMPNSTARVVLQESISMRSLIDRAKTAKSPQLRLLYLTMVSRATYQRGDDWKQLRDLYKDLKDDRERALVLAPLARENDAKLLLWDALRGGEPLREAAVTGLLVLSHRADSSPDKIARFLLQEIKKDPRDERITHAVRAMSRLDIPAGWNPPDEWDTVLSDIFSNTKDLSTRARILTLLLSLDTRRLAEGKRIKPVLLQVAQDPPPQLYASLLTLLPRVGIDVRLQPPEKATIDDVLARLPRADAKRGRELFFSRSSATACARCHRVAGRGNNLAPDLSGIGVRSDAKKIAQSILDPSATITEGYERHTFITKEGLTIEGAVLQESGSRIRIVTTNGRVEVLDAGLIEARKKSKVSAMPKGFELLGNDQVADLVAFLASLRQGATNAPASRSR